MKSFIHLKRAGFSINRSFLKFGLLGNPESVWFIPGRLKANRLLISIILLLALYACSPPVKLVTPAKGASKSKEDTSKTEPVILGLENFLANHVDKVKGKRVGLVTNPSGVNRNLQSSADLFFEHPDINLTALFGPEHGIRGDIFAGHNISDQVDPKTGLPVYSLYGKNRKPTEEMLDSIDVLIFDIQDIGIRSYTFISTMGLIIEAAAEFDKEIIILDRPNPIGGLQIEGSIVGMDFIPLLAISQSPTGME